MFCREVHHSGLGEEGDSVPRLSGETGSTEEDPGQFSKAETSWLENKNKKVSKINQTFVRY